MLRSLRVVLLCGLSGIALSACGDDGDDGGGGGVDAAEQTGTPTASFTMSPDCTTSAATEITFTSTSTDPEGDELSCSWMFASGTPSTATTCEVTGVTFPNQAPYQITLTVTDTDGNEDSSTMTISPC